ncbi:MAG: CHAT domain-containing protein [Nocardioidaceae bacterium]
MTRGSLRLELGRSDAACQDFERASSLLGPARAVEVDAQRAAVAQNAGRLDEAAGLYRGILKQSGLSAAVQTSTANNLGLLEATLGNHESAARWMRRAAATAPRVGPAYVALVAESSAWAAVQAGALTEGVAKFDEAVRLWEKADLPLGELYAEYADALLNLRLLPEAREQAERAADALHAQGVDLMAVEAQLRSARLALLMGDARTAEERAEDTVARLRSQRRADWRARAVLVAVEARLFRGEARRDDHAVAVRAATSLLRSGVPQVAADAYLAAGRVARTTGRTKLAVADWERAAELAPRVPVLARVKGHLARALAAHARSSDAELLAACRLGLTDLARHRAALPSTELRALASGHGAELAALGLGAVERSGSPAQVLAWMEHTRAAALSAVEPDPVDGIDDELSGLRAVQTEVVRARRADRTALPALLKRQSEIEARIRHQTWTGSSHDAATSSARFSVGALRERLAGRVLVEYDVHDGRIIAAVVGDRRTRMVQVADRATVEAEIDELRSALYALNVCVLAMVPFLHATSVSLVERLRSLLVEPLGLPVGAPVVVVPVGDLQRVPWSAMFDGPVSVAPSASLWVQASRRNAPEAPVVLAAGPELSGAVPEVEALAEKYGDAQVLTPPASRVDVVRSAIEGASLVHLSCHGEVRVDNPTFSSLQLSDGSLTVHELDRGAGAPHRLVLAACDVGGGVSYPGNEVLGFIGTVLSRGTAGVVASTMLVLDQHVTPLMLGLHDGLRSGLTLADALHQARGAVDLDDPRSYPSWCTFTAFGAG